jgi:Spy/CpxP family protein refolding chaperone
MSAVPSSYRWLLLLSLALNLGLGAALLATHWHQPDAQHGGERRWGRIPDSRQLARILDPADQAILGDVVQAHRAELSEHYRPLGHSRRALAEALRAEPFDPRALQSTFEQMRGAETGTANAMHAFMLDLATRVSPAGRHAIADRLERHGRGHGRQDRAGPGTEPPPPDSSVDATTAPEAAEPDHAD